MPTPAAVFRRSCAAFLLLTATGCTAATPATTAHNPGFVAVRPSEREWGVLSQQTRDEIGQNNCLGEKMGWWRPGPGVEEEGGENPCAPDQPRLGITLPW